MSDHHTDEKFLRQALDLARRGIGLTAPNPNVGAVIVNNRGEVVGLASKYPVKPPRQVAFIWDPVHGMRELGRLIPENSGWGILFQVADINEGGQIIGNDKYQGRELGYLLTPSVSEEP